jgi:sulfite exporter TauE/SafE
MSLWAVFLTGLLAGGASCAAVQGGLLAGVVARRRQPQPVGAAQKPSLSPGEVGSGGDLLPVAGFLAGKLVSHAALGAALGVLGSALQLSFRSRAGLQILAGAVMLVLAADLLGVRAVRRFVPRAPGVWGRLVRRSGRWGGALGPAVLGSATVLIPCGVTLSMEFLAVASGSPLSGAAVMAAFVVGTTPLFAVIGYAARRSTTALRARLSVLAAAAVVVAGLVSINAGLTLSGSSFTLSSAWRSLSSGPAGPAATVPAVEDGRQEIVITVRSAGYSPARVPARAGVPTRLVLRSDGADGCTSAIVFPSLGVERYLPVDGDTVVDVGTLRPGKHRFTCSMGMYSGVIEATA